MPTVSRSMVTALWLLLVLFETYLFVNGLPASRQPRPDRSAAPRASSATHCVLSCNQAGQVVQICNGCRVFNISLNEHFCDITKACSKPRPCAGDYLKEQQRLWPFGEPRAYGSCLDVSSDKEGTSTFRTISGKLAGQTTRMASCALPEDFHQEHATKVSLKLAVKKKAGKPLKWRKRACVCFNGRWIKLGWMKRLTSSSRQTTSETAASQKKKSSDIENAFCLFRSGSYKIVKKTELWEHLIA